MHIIILLVIWGFFITLAVFLFQVVFSLASGILALIIGGAYTLIQKIFSKDDSDDWTV